MGNDFAVRQQQSPSRCSPHGVAHGHIPWDVSCWTTQPHCCWGGQGQDAAPGCGHHPHPTRMRVAGATVTSVHEPVCLEWEQQRVALLHPPWPCSLAPGETQTPVSAEGSWAKQPKPSLPQPGTWLCHTTHPWQHH